MGEAYSDFAGVYDELMDNVPYAEWCETLIQFIKKYGISKPVRGENAAFRDETFETADGEESDRLLASERNLVLDMGCGTGTLTQMLYDKGYDMIGVDNAPAMLQAAMDKREKNGSEILYLLQDMRELELYSTVGTVISVCDSVNYILEEDELSEVFFRVNNYLYPGGLFIFDFNTDYKYREIIGDTVIAENREDCSFIWENFYDEDCGLNRYDVTFFVQEKGDIFRRFTETHVQRGYSAEQMKSLVTAAGFEILEIRDMDTYGEITQESGRICVVAREHSKKRNEKRVVRKFDE